MPWPMWQGLSRPAGSLSVFEGPSAIGADIVAKEQRADRVDGR